MTNPALLVLEDGTTLRGTAFGADGETFGVVKVAAADPLGLDVRLPGRADMVRVPKECLAPLSAHGLPQEAFDRIAFDRANAGGR